MRTFLAIAVNELCVEVSCFNFLVDFVHLLVGEFVLGDDPDGEEQEDGRDHAHEPEDALQGERGLRGGIGVEAHPGEDEARNDTAKGHAGLEEDAGEGVHDAGDALAGGVFAVGDDLRGTRRCTSGSCR